MRFEIRTAGMVVILLGLASLSAIVFALGMVAGYGMARQAAPEAAQVANVFPAPTPPAVEPSPVPSPAAEAMTSPAAVPTVSPAAAPSEVAPAVLPTRRPAAMPTIAERESPPVLPEKSVEPSPEASATPKVARETTAPETPPKASGAAEASPSGEASAARATEHIKPYNIQIDAVMDRQNAEQMSERIEKLGYHAFLVPTTIDGQTWWRVRVGPYRTEDEARAAQAQLREQYSKAYSSNHF